MKMLYKRGLGADSYEQMRSARHLV